MKQFHVASYGAGVDSTAMILRMIEEKMPLDHVVFADTGGEIPETYQTISHMMKVLKKEDIPFTIVYPFKLRSLFERCFTRKVTPDRFRRWCTRDAKVKPIHKFYKKILGGFIHEYMGIDAGETKRVRIAKEPFIKKYYPLIDWEMDRLDCLKYISEKGFPITLKSGCYFCPFNSTKRWQEIKKNHPELFEKAMELEENNKRFPKQTLAKVQLKDIDTLVAGDTDDYCGNGFS